MKTWRNYLCLFLALIFALAISGTVFAQTGGLQLSLGKISGIGLGGQIQGFFRLSASGPADLASVTFQIDGKEMETVNQAPFAFNFNTDSYTPGQHRFTATGRTASGQVLTSNPVDTEIVSFSEGWQSVVRLLWPIFAVIIVALLVALAVPLISAKSNRHYEPGAARQYGVAGGTVCSRCGRPYALSFLSVHLLGSRLARCPYCGKWAFARPASQETLRAAEQAEMPIQPVVHAETPEEILKREIEESRLSR